MNHIKKKIAITMLTSLALFSGIGIHENAFAAKSTTTEQIKRIIVPTQNEQTENTRTTEDGIELPEGATGVYNTLGEISENGTIDNTQITIIPDGSGVVTDEFRGFTQAVETAVENGICPPINSAADISNCVLKLDTMQYRYGGGFLNEDAGQEYASMMTPEQNLILFAAASGDAEAQAILFSQDPRMYEYATEEEKESINALIGTNLTEENILNQKWEERDQIKREYLSKYSEAPIEKWEEWGWLKEADNMYDYIITFPSVERIEEINREEERKAQREAEEENLDDEAKEELQALNETLNHPIAKAIGYMLGGGVILLGGEYVTKQLLPKYQWYGDKAKEILENPRD